MNSNFYLEAVLDRFDQLWLTQFPDGVIKTMDERTAPGILEAV